MSKFINKLNGITLRKITYGLLYLVAILFMFAIVSYIAKTGFGKNGEPVGFQLATISAIIGGFILTSAFVDKEPQNSDLRLNLKHIGILYLIGTIAFVVFGIYFQIIEMSHWFIYVSAISMVAGALSFAMGTVLLALQMPRLWSSS